MILRHSKKMPKRKITAPAKPSPKAQKVNSQPVPTFLNPLQNKIKVNGTALSGKRAESEVFKMLNDAYPLLSSIDKQSAEFIFSTLAAKPAFKKLDLHKKPIKNRQGNRRETYNFANKQISLSPAPSADIPNPISALIHEGTHALDDLHMKTYQKTIPSFLAKHLKGTKIDKDRGNWYTGAQQILPNQSFQNYYPYKGEDESAHEDIKNSMHDLQLPLRGQPQSIQTFEAAAQELANGNRQVDPADDSLFQSLSEFPAFAVESLSKPWEIEWKGKGKNKKIVGPANNIGRKLLKKVAKDVYSNFQGLDQNFNESYPDTNQAFRDRIVELRNQNKYPNKADYIKHLQDKGTFI